MQFCERVSCSCKIATCFELSFSEQNHMFIIRDRDKNLTYAKNKDKFIEQVKNNKLELGEYEFTDRVYRRILKYVEDSGLL